MKPKFITTTLTDGPCAWQTVHVAASKSGGMPREVWVCGPVPTGALQPGPYHRYLRAGGGYRYAASATGVVG